MSLSYDPVHARFSLEFFPPKGLSGERALTTGAHVLRRFKPEFQTVTFGADGAAIEGSLDWPAGLQKLNNVPTAAHITLCQFASPTEFLAHADTLWQQGIERLVVLRGDGSEGGGLAGFASVAQAIAELKKLHSFDVSVAAYPEVHPLAESGQKDLDVLLAKQEAGADRAITQFFFNNEDFYRFRERAERARFYKELVPGIMPISNFSKISGFAKRCGASIPLDLVERFERAADNKEEQSNVAREVACEQVRDLARNGVEAIHIYTMNRVDLAADSIRAFCGEFSRATELVDPKQDRAARPKLALVG